MANIGDFLPLAPATLHIMMALVGQNLHGYGIMREIKETTEDRYELGPGTLYDNLQRLLDQGLVQETAGPGGQDPRRRYYRLTALGQSVVVAEIDRLEAAFGTVKARLKLPKPRKA
jgi:DNA-binding PadR family transcriptional regulator